MGQGMARLDAIREIGVVEQTYYRWRRQYGGMGTDQVKELKRLQKENERLRKAVSDLTLDKLILKEAAKGNFQAPRVAGPVSIWFEIGLAFPSVGPVACWVNTVPRIARSHRVAQMKSGLSPI